MFAVVFRILLRAAFTLLLLTACVFFGLHMTGDPARIMLGNAADEVALEAFRAQWGLNLPLWQQFLVYLEKFVLLDMGTSYMTGQPVRDVFLDALVFSIQLGWLPSYGNATVWHYIMPIITMATSEAAIFSRYARSAMIDALRLPCVRAARMRGLPERRIIWLHALPNAMLSILTILGFFLGTLVAGAVITENVFSWPGVGKLLVQSVASRDIPVVQMIVLVTGASLVTANLLMDLLALVVNPRLRKGDN